MRSQRGWTDDQVEAMAWDLEVAMMKIRKDPQAALAEGLAKIRAQQLEELHALWAKVEAKQEAALAQLEEDQAKMRAADIAEWEEMRARRKADIAQLDEEWAAAVAEFRTARADRLRQLVAAEAAEQPTRLQ